MFCHGELWREGGGAVPWWRAHQSAGPSPAAAKRSATRNKGKYANIRLLTCAQPLEVLIIRPLSRRHDQGALIFERGPGECRMTGCVITRRSVPSLDKIGVEQGPEPFRKASQTSTKRVAAGCRRVYYVPPSEYRTKEITSALLCLITDHGRGCGVGGKYRETDRIRRAINESSISGRHSVGPQMNHWMEAQARFCDLINIFPS